MNILFIQLKRIGDLILTTPAIAAARNKYPSAKITLVISRESEALLPAIAHVDQTIVMRRGLSDFKNFLKVFRQKFDYCVDFTRNDRSASLTLLSRARKRIVSVRLKRRSKFRRHAYNEFVEHRMHDMHMIEYNLSLLEPLGITAAAPAVELKLPADVRLRANELRKRFGIGDDFIIFHSGSARAEKFWEPDRWAGAIRAIRGQWKSDCVLTGGKSVAEQNHIAQIKSRLGKDDVVDLSGQTDLLGLAALIADARLVVTVDSAPVHIAAALHTPQVVLFGPTNPFHWRPRESPALILQGESRTPVTEFAPKQMRFPMNLISTEAVIYAMNSLLSERTRYPAHEGKEG